MVTRRRCYVNQVTVAGEFGDDAAATIVPGGSATDDKRGRARREIPLLEHGRR